MFCYLNNYIFDTPLLAKASNAFRLLHWGRHYRGLQNYIGSSLHFKCEPLIIKFEMGKHNFNKSQVASTEILSLIT